MPSEWWISFLSFLQVQVTALPSVAPQESCPASWLSLARWHSSNLYIWTSWCLESWRDVATFRMPRRKKIRKTTRRIRTKRRYCIDISFMFAKFHYQSISNIILQYSNGCSVSLISPLFSLLFLLLCASLLVLSCVSILSCFSHHIHATLFLSDVWKRTFGKGPCHKKHQPLMCSLDCDGWPH